MIPVQMAQYLPGQYVKTDPSHQPQYSRHVITQQVATDDNLDKKKQLNWEPSLLTEKPKWRELCFVWIAQDEQHSLSLSLLPMRLLPNFKCFWISSYLIASTLGIFYEFYLYLFIRNSFLTPVFCLFLTLISSIFLIMGRICCVHRLGFKRL